MKGRRVLLGAAVVFVAAAALVAATGGVRVVLSGVRVSARSPIPFIGASAVATASWWWLARHGRRADLEAAWGWIEHRGAAIILSFSAMSALIAAVWATHSPSGSDPSGYLSEAAMLASGHLAAPDTLASLPGWPADPWLSTPLGWRPALTPGFQVPTYAIGLPLLMAVPHLVAGTWGACLIVAVSAGVAVWATGQTALRIGSPASGAIAAAALASMPVFLYQSVQPMSDVPVTAAWMATWALLTRDGRATLGAGLACAVAVLVRPNLAPLAIVPAFVVAMSARTRRDMAAFAVPVALAGVAIALVQWGWYGSPLRSGYGTASALFDIGNIGANLSRYGGWVMTSWPLVLLAPFGAFAVRRHRATWPLVVFAAGVVASYLVYAVFEEWWYLRFVLPALAVAAVLVAAALAAIFSRAPVVWRAPAMAVLVVALVATGVGTARSRGAFRLAGDEQRIVGLGAHFSGAMPSDAVIVAGEQSGAMRYLTARSIVRWDLSTPQRMSSALDALAAAGRPVWIILDSWEEPLVRERLPSSPVGMLDWPPAVEAGDIKKTRAWRLSDRQAFISGAPIDTVRLR